MLQSMTGFARREGAVGALAWAWELRSVNGRGLDLRLRVPAGFDSIEPALREAAGRLLRRGNVTANLAIRTEEVRSVTVDTAHLDRLLELAMDLARRIPGAAPPTAEGLLALPGVLRTGASDSEAVDDTQRAAVAASFGAALDALVVARQEEGARLAEIVSARIDEIAALRDQASRESADQPALQRERMLTSVAALLRDQPGLPEERIAQEVAVLATRTDVREELDRLTSHIEAARALLADGEAVGRRFDFLVQEFVRETNTLCSKSASPALTTTGLALKAVIEQLREQVQNVE